MGRTVPTYRMASESLFQSWSDYRRALPQEDREAFDRLSDKVRLHASACSVAAFLDPLEGAGTPAQEGLIGCADGSWTATRTRSTMRW